jgi:hypothetical protein
MATVEDLNRRVRQLELEIRRIKSNLDDAATYLKRAEDPDVQTAGRRLG